MLKEELPMCCFEWTMTDSRGKAFWTSDVSSVLACTPNQVHKSSCAQTRSCDKIYYLLSLACTPWTSCTPSSSVYFAFKSHQLSYTHYVHRSTSPLEIIARMFWALPLALLVVFLITSVLLMTLANFVGFT